MKAVGVDWKEREGGQGGGRTKRGSCAIGMSSVATSVANLSSGRSADRAAQHALFKSPDHFARIDSKL